MLTNFIKNNMIEEKLKNIKMLVMDVDGTLTDGKVYYSKNGEELKCFSIRDGMGIDLFHINGFQTGIITSENSQIVTARSNKLNIKNVILGSRNKSKDLSSLAEITSMSMINIAYIGDDINDLPALMIVGFSVCPADAVDSVKSVCDYVCAAKGGAGAIREVVEMILKSQNKSITLPEKW
jgi:YrbI family 3-deoxy-D-manno-octulosonate 8-phosphate phosphatase